MCMRAIIAIALIVSLGACSEGKSKEEGLKQFSRSKAVQEKIAKARARTALRQPRPELKMTYDLNGRWSSKVVEADRHLELSFGMDDVVVVDLASPRGSVASAQGKYAFVKNAPVSITLVSPPAMLKPYVNLGISKGARGLEVLIGTRRIALSRM